jgi:hypothetical protein
MQVKTQLEVKPKTNAALRNFLLGLFENLERQGVSYCVLRNYEGLPEYIENDIDLLVDPKEDGAFRICLSETAKANGWVLVKEASRLGYHGYWFADIDFGKFVQIDVLLGLYWKGIRWIEHHHILETRRRWKQFFVPDATAEAGTLLLKDLFSLGSVKRKYQANIREFTCNHPQQLEDFLGQSLGKKLAARLVVMAQQGMWNVINRNRRRIVLAAIGTSFRRSPFSLIVGFVRFLLRHLWARFACKAGLFLVLIGPDGSGKSTVAEGLQKDLSSLFKRRQYYHGHFGTLPELKVFRNFFLRLLGKKLPEPPVSEYAQVENPRANGFFRALMYVCYYSLDYFVGYLVVNKARAYGDLIIFDRYFYDYFLAHEFNRVPRFLLPIMKMLLPKPDLLVYLYNSPDVVARRKADLTREQIEKQQQRCELLVRSMPYAVTVPTEIPSHEVIKQVSNLVIRLMVNRARKQMCQQRIQKSDGLAHESSVDSPLL